MKRYMVTYTGAYDIEANSKEEAVEQFNKLSNDEVAEQIQVDTCYEITE